MDTMNFFAVCGFLFFCSASAVEVDVLEPVFDTSLGGHEQTRTNEAEKPVVSSHQSSGDRVPEDVRRGFKLVEPASNEPLGQPGSPGIMRQLEPGSGQTGMLGSSGSGFGLPGMGSGFGQSSMMGPPGMMGQQGYGFMGQPGMMGQYGSGYGLPNTMGYNYGQPGMMGQQGYGSMVQPGTSGQLGTMGQPGSSSGIPEQQKSEVSEHSISKKPGTHGAISSPYTMTGFPWGSPYWQSPFSQPGLVDQQKIQKQTVFSPTDNIGFPWGSPYWQSPFSQPGLADQSQIQKQFVSSPSDYTGFPWSTSYWPNTYGQPDAVYQPASPIWAF